MITTKADERKRVVIPQVKPGTVLAVMENGDRTFTLSPVRAQKRKAGILAGLRPLSRKECVECWGPDTKDSESDRIAAAMASSRLPRLSVGS